MAWERKRMPLLWSFEEAKRFEPNAAIPALESNARFVKYQANHDILEYV